MTARKINTFRLNDTTPEDHLGRLGEITYRDGYLYYHNGVTPGGELIGGGSGGSGGPTSWASVTGKPSIPTDINDLTDIDGLLANTGDFTFTGGTASLPAGDTMVLDTFQVGGNKQSTLTLSTATISSLDAGNNLRLRTGYGTGFEKDWILGADGSIRFPDASVQTTAYTGSDHAAYEITNTSSEGSIYSVSVSTSGIVTMTTARGSLEFGAQPEEGAPQHLHIMRPADQGGSTDLYFGDDYNYFKLPGNYGAGTLGVDIGANDGAGGAQHVWRFGTDGNLTLPAGGDIKDSTGASVLGSGGSANTGDITFNSGTLSNPVDQAVRLQTSNTTQTASYSFTPGNEYSTAVWTDQEIVFNDPTQAVYDAIWALTDVSVIEIQVNGNWQTVTYTGSSTPGLPAAPTLFVNQTAVDGPLTVDVAEFSIRQGTQSYVEIDGSDFRVDVQDDIRMYANDTFRLSNRSSENSIVIETNDGEHSWYFRANGTLELPNGGTIVDENGNNVIPTVPTSVSQLTNDSGFIAMVAVPASSLGAPGDEPGKVAFDAGYIYYCTTFYDGVANIWKRVAWSVDTW